MIVNQRNTLVPALLAVFATATPAWAQNSEVRTNTSGEVSGEATVDGGNEQTFDTTMQLARKSLPSRDRWQVDLVLEYATSTLSREDLRRTFHGKTGQELLGMAAMLMERYDLDKDGQLDKHERDEMRSDIADARIQRNEAAALASLQQLAAAEKKAQAEVLIDVDGDEVGEFAYIAELTGAVAPRGRGDDGEGVEEGEEGGETAAQPLLPATWQVVDGLVRSNGYAIQLWLPDLDLLAVPEGQSGGVGKRPPGTKTASQFWVAMAWPQENEVTGRRAFCITQEGRILQTDNLLQRYSGADGAPDPFAAFERGTGKFGPALREIKAYNDGGQWKQVR